MKSVRLDGQVVRARRKVYSSDAVMEEDASNPGRIADLLRVAMQRISELEARLADEGIEFEANVGAAGALSRFEHGFGKSVRFWPVYWSGATAAPILARSSDSTDNTLVLASYTAGRVVIRIEPSDAGIT